jgi:autotransporter passenger strand-loop-strand repeat protein
MAYEYYFVTNGVTSTGLTLSDEDRMFVSKGGTASNTIVSEDGWLYIQAGGTANSTTIKMGGYMFVSNGGTANGVAIKEYGELHLSSGGTATNLEWTPGVGYFYFDDGAVVTFASEFSGIYYDHGSSHKETVTGMTVEGTMYVMADGVADKITLDASTLSIWSGGSANDVTVNDGGLFHIYSGGTATNVTWTPGEGYVYVHDGAVVTFVNEYSGVYLGTFDDPTVHAATMDGIEGEEESEGFDMYVMADGIANNTKLTDYDRVFVWSGGTVNDTTIQSLGAYVYVYSGGTANKTAVANYGTLDISRGGSADSTTINNGGSLKIHSGGTATNVLENGGYVDVGEGATVSFLSNTISDMSVYASATIHSGTTAKSTTIYNGTLIIFSGGIANNTILKGDYIVGHGALHVSSGGTANGIQAIDGDLFVSSGGKLTGQITITDDTAVDVFVYSDATLDFDISELAPNNKACFNDLSLLNGWSNASFTLTVSGTQQNGAYKLAGGATGFNKTITVSDTSGTELGTITAGGEALIKDGKSYTLTLDGEKLGFTVADNKIPDLTGELTGTRNITENMYASGVIVKTGGFLIIESGGTATKTDLSGFLNVYEGGLAEDTTVNKNAWATISSGGVARDINVKSYGLLDIKSDGKLTGSMTIEDGAAVSAFTGAIIDFDISALSPDNTVLLNNLSLIAEDPSFTLTVSDSQEDGTYYLAGSAAGFSETITIVNTSGTELGTITVDDGETKIGDFYYTLALDPTSTLMVTVSEAGSGGGDVFGDNHSFATAYDLGSDSSIKSAEGASIASMEKDYYSFKLTQRAAVTLQTTGSDANADTILYLYDSSHALIASNDDIGTGIYYSKVAKTLDPGTYYVMVNAYEDTMIDNYSLSVTVSEAGSGGDVFGDNHSFATAYDLGSDSSIKSAEGASIDSMEKDYYSFKLTQRAAVTLQTTGSDANADTILYLYDSSQALIASNDDIRTGIYYSKVAKTLDPGTYYVMVNAYEDTMIDNYSLTVTLNEEGGGDKTPDITGDLARTVNLTDGMYASGVNINNNGAIFVSQGGITSDTTINAEGFMGISQGGIASSTTINAEGCMAVFQGGIASDTTINYLGDMTVSEGGIANSVTVNYGGDLFISGGSAYLVKENGGYVEDNSEAASFVSNSFSGHSYTGDDWATVHSGTTASELTFADEACLEVYSGGSARDIKLNATGSAYISSGGFLSGMTVSNGGKLVICDTGKLTGEMKFETGALVSAYTGAILDFDISELSPDNDVLLTNLSLVQGAPTCTLTTSGAQALGTYNLADGVAGFGTTITVKSILGETAGTLSLDSGATKIGDVYYILDLNESLLTVTVSENENPMIFTGELTGATKLISAGSSAVDVSIYTGGILHILDGGVASNTTVNDSGKLNVSKGGVASGVTVKTDGGIAIFSGGILTGKMVFENGAVVNADDGAVFDFDLTQATPGADADPLLNDLSVVTGSRKYTLTVSGSEEDGIYLLAGGAAGFTSTITVNSTEEDELGTISVADGTTTLGGVKYTLFVSDSTLALTIGDGPGKLPDITGDLTETFTLTDGMLGSSVTIYDGGELHVSNGGVAIRTTINDDGELDVFSGGVASDTIVNSNGDFSIVSGEADGVTVNFGGEFFISSGGTAHQVKENGGYVKIYECDDTDVEFESNSFSGYVYRNDDEWATVHSGTTASDLTFQKDACLFVFSSGIVRGITVSAGGEVNLDSEGILTGKMTFEKGAIVSASDGAFIDFDISGLGPENAAIVNNLAIIKGAPIYTLTVNGTQANGVYKLAEGAEGFNKTITVMNADETVGTLTVNGGPTEIGGIYYTLALSGADLSVKVATPVKDYGPEEPYNDDLFTDDKSGVSEKILGFVGTPLDDTVEEIRLDKSGSVVNEAGYHNFVNNSDKVDYAKITLTSAAKLSFILSATDKVKFTLVSISTKKKNGQEILVEKSLKTASLSKAGSTKPTKSVLLQADTYYVKVEYKNTNKNTNQNGAFYNLSLADLGVKTYYYADGDDGKNNGPLLVKNGKVKVPNMDQIKNFLPIAITASGTQEVVFDTNDIAAEDANPNDDDWKNYVGFGDDNDYVKLNLTQPAKLNFTVQSTGNVKLVVYKVTQSGGKWSQKTVKSLTVSLKRTEKDSFATRPSGDILLSRLVDNLEDGAGYYVSVQSTTAKGGGQAWYNVSVESTVFASDTGANNTLFTDKKSKFFNEELKSTEIAADGKSNPITMENGELAVKAKDASAFASFVGYGDELDYAQVEFKEAGVCTFTFDTYGTAKGAAKFTLYKLTQKSNGSWTKKTIGAITVRNSGSSGYGSGSISKAINITDVSGDVKYYVLVQATNSTSKKGEMYYNLTASIPSIETAALSMPETELAAGIDAQDSLFAGLDAAQDTALASALLDPASEKLFADSASGLLASL